MTASIGANHKFSSSASFLVGSSTAVMNVAPKPLPVPVYDNRTIVHEILPVASSAGVVTAGGKVITPLGVAVTDGILEFNFDYVKDDVADILETLYLSNVVIYYTPDGGSTVYTLRWTDGRPFVRSRPEGAHNFQSVRMMFHILATS